MLFASITRRMMMEIDETNWGEYIAIYERGDILVGECLELFSFLIRTGKCWTLQGFYGRIAESFIDMGHIDTQGNIDYEYFNSIGVSLEAPLYDEEW